MQRLRKIYDTYRQFRKTRFFGEYTGMLCLTAVELFIAVTALICCLLRWRIQGDVIWLMMLVCLTVVVVVVTNLYQLYHLVIRHAVRVQELEEKYTLINAEESIDFSDSMSSILDLVDTITEREYSNKLLQKQAELQAMKSQINPHFLYNTLDSIRGYAMMEEAPITSDMIEVLSHIFRYTVSQKQDMVSIMQELNIAVDYIKIQEYRANGKITFIQNVESDVDANSYKIPKLIMQPLIENAVKHAFVGIVRNPVILVNVYRTEERLIISIKDNGRGMLPEQVAALNAKLAADENLTQVRQERKNADGKKGTGIALSNINQRLKLIYGLQYGLTIYSSFGEGSDFQLSLPYISFS